MKDRSVGLILFGALQILLGVAALCGLFAVAAASELQARGGAGAPPMSAMLPTILLYAIFAFYFFAVGIGSIRKRRWARALSLVVSAMWLVVGLIALVVVIILMPRFTTLFPPSQSGAIVATMFGFLGVIYIALPLVLVLFYRGPNVKATVEARDPVTRWTDRVPLPILALVLVMAFSALSVVGATTYGAVPIFGTILTGAPAAIVFVAIGILCAYLSVQLYRVKRSAWWTLVLLDIIGGANGAYTLARTDLEKLYDQMGLMTPQLRAMHIFEIYRDPRLWAFMAVCWLAMFAYIIWTRRFFDAPPPRTRAGDAAVIAQS